MGSDYQERRTPCGQFQVPSSHQMSFVWPIGIWDFAAWHVLSILCTPNIKPASESENDREQVLVKIVCHLLIIVESFGTELRSDIGYS